MRQAAKKANQVLGQINRSFSCHTKDVMSQIHKVFVRPHLEYAVAAWSPWHQKDKDTLEKIQRRATRRISNIRGSYPERLRQLNLTTLEERRKRGDAIEVFKCLNGFWDIEKKNSFAVRGSVLWNSLPSNVRKSSSTNAFKNAYDLHMRTN